MEAADVLYGVTMGSDGVSQVALAAPAARARAGGERLSRGALDGGLLPRDRRRLLPAGRLD